MADPKRFWVVVAVMAVAVVLLLDWFTHRIEDAVNERRAAAASARVEICRDYKDEIRKLIEDLTLAAPPPEDEVEARRREAARQVVAARLDPAECERFRHG